VVHFEGEGAVAIDGANYRWPNAVVPYQIAADHPKKADILKAITHVTEKTKVCLTPRTNQTDYIRFVSGSGCSSYVGRQGGVQDVEIGACSFGSIAHEISHAAGLWHEHSREDRDNFVTIHWENIQSSKEHNFVKHVSDGIDIRTYDYGSIMHYSPTAFSKNGNPTISVKIPPGTSSTVIGQRIALSPKDIAGINYLYPKASGCGCQEDCLSFNPDLVAVNHVGARWKVVNSASWLFDTGNLAEA
jgi:astacin